jgi:branched-chain amino acid transport system permease protein
VSETATLPAPAVQAQAQRRGRVRPPALARIGLVALLAVLPLYIDVGLLTIGLFAMAAVVAAIGLTILVGAAGQLSLGHAFFLAVGAYGYAYFAGSAGVAGASSATGLGLDPLLAAVLAVLVAGFVGLLFSPIASRLRGIYLGVASLSLVFIGEFLYENVRSVTGGFNGRAAPPFSLFGWEFTDANTLVVAGVPFGRFEKLWELFLIVLVLSYLFANNVLRGRMGRAMQTMRDSEVAAAVMGVDVRRTKAGVFVLSSMYAGLGGVMVALAFGRLTPSYFSLALSIGFLAAIVVGGLGSVGGAAVGAFFVTAGPLLITRYSSSLPFISASGSGGYDGGKAAALLYGLAVVLVVLFEPGGLAGLGQGLTGRRTARALAPAPLTGSSTPEESS